MLHHVMLESNCKAKKNCKLPIPVISKNGLRITMGLKSRQEIAKNIVYMVCSARDNTR